MPAQFTIITTGLPKLRPKALRDAKRLAMWDVANQWHVRYSLLHFTPQGARRYRMVPRMTKIITQGLIRRTRSGKPRAPSGNPLTWSGRSKALSRSKKIRATATWSKVTSPIRAFNFAPKGNPRLAGGQMSKEYTRVQPVEQRDLQKVAVRSVAKELGIARTRVTVRF